MMHKVLLACREILQMGAAGTTGRATSDALAQVTARKGSDVNLFAA